MARPAWERPAGVCPSVTPGPARYHRRVPSRHHAAALSACLLLITASVQAQPQSAAVAGIVVEIDGHPVPDAVVELTDPLGAVLQTLGTGADGRFAFAGVPPGRFIIRAHPRGAPRRTAARALTLEAALPADVQLRLPPGVEEVVQVEGRRETASARLSLGGDSLDGVPARVRGRALQDAVATFPGWATEDNGLLHARGVDDGFLYVVDGVPVYERLDTLNGIAPDAAPLESIAVITGYVAPEFGYKAGGVIDVQSASAAERWRASGDWEVGRYTTTQGGLAAAGPIARGVGVHLAGSGARSDRYLDPVDPDNRHNSGGQAATSGGLDFRRARRDRLTIAWTWGQSRYDVPNTAEQDAAGQNQRQRIGSRSLTASWQRSWSDRTVTQVAAYHRRTHAALDGSQQDVPLYAAADRRLQRTGAIVSVTRQLQSHVVKLGAEAQALMLEEGFTFFVTDPEEAEEARLGDAALAHDMSNPFAFGDDARRGLLAFYAQDTWPATARWTISAGVRVDRSTLLLPRTEWSPRLGAAYQAGAETVIRASVSRFFQPPQPEFVLLSSSEEARALSPFVSDPSGGGAGIEPERQWTIEAGVEHQFRRWRLAAAYWRREGRDVADPNVFFGTTVIFPNAVAKGRAHGLDLRVEVPRSRGWSAYASASLSAVTQTGPVTGGLFLEDEIGVIEPGMDFVPDHDQRAVAAAGATWQHGSGLTVSGTARFESGTPLQRDDDEEESLADRPGAELVDFDRGRVKPRFLVSVIASAPLLETARLRLRIRASVLNMFDRAYAYNFGNPFSGTHFGAPRTAAIALDLLTR